MHPVTKNLVCTLALAVSLPTLTGGCSATTAKPKTVAQQQQSFFGKVTDGVKSGAGAVKSGADKMVAAVVPQKRPQFSNPVSTPRGKPGPNLFVAAAQMHELGDRFEDAEANYRKALELNPGHLEALIGFARMEDRRGNFEAATKYYQRAIRKHPKDASVHNDLGLCYHRRNMLPEATRELRRAVDLDGDSKLYRNNLAAVYVEQGKQKEALSHLIAAHGTSVGHYNLGYLLMQKQDNEAALREFRKAAETDPNMQAARQWVARLSTPAEPYASYAGGQSAVAQPGSYNGAPNANAAYVAQRPAQPGGGSYLPQPQYAPGPQHAPQPQYAPQPGGMYQPQQPQGDPMPPLPR